MAGPGVVSATRNLVYAAGRMTELESEGPIAGDAPAPPPVPAREILPYAILSGLCGLLPVPIVDDFAASLVRGAMLRRLAHRRDLKIDRFAQKILVRSHAPAGGAPGQIALSALRIAFRKVFLVVNVGLRADDALATFVLGALFDRYCGQIHRRVGDGEWVAEGRAGQIHAAVESALRGAGTQVLREVFVKALSSGWDWVRVFRRPWLPSPPASSGAARMPGARRPSRSCSARSAASSPGSPTWPRKGSEGSATTTSGASSRPSTGRWAMPRPWPLLRTLRSGPPPTSARLRRASQAGLEEVV